jgi:hypothetical protein
MMPAWIRLCALVMLGALCAACASSAPAEEEPVEEFEAPSERVLVEVTVIAMQKSGFPVGAGVEPGKLSATSGWHISLAPFRGKGYREQCEVVWTPRSPRKYSVDIRVKREKNDDIVKPLDITYAAWVEEPDNEDRAAIVRQYLRSMLGTPVTIGPKRKGL